jgi:hypothetical protein
MESNIIQLLMVLLAGGIATYDTVKSKRRKQNEKPEETGEIFNLQN